MAHVLIVDDDRSIRRSLEKFLQDEGHDVLTAQDGPEGLDCIRAAAARIVLAARGRYSGLFRSTARRMRLSAEIELLDGTAVSTSSLPRASRAS